MGCFDAGMRPNKATTHGSPPRLRPPSSAAGYVPPPLMEDSVRNHGLTAKGARVTDSSRGESPAGRREVGNKDIVRVSDGFGRRIETREKAFTSDIQKPQVVYDSLFAVFRYH